VRQGGAVQVKPVTYYSIVRYVPDAIRGEQVNVGVIALKADGSFAGVRFDRTFARARTLGRRRDVGFLRELRKSLEDLAEDQNNEQLPFLVGGERHTSTLAGHPRLEVPLLTSLSTRWSNSIQLSEPRASLETDPLRLLDEVYRRYVAPEEETVGARARDRRWIVARAARALEARVQTDLTEQPSEFVRRNHEVDGAVERHMFEIVLGRMEVAHAIGAISFESDDRDLVAREVESAAWTIDDTRRARPALPITLLVIEREDSAELKRAERICRALSATVVRSGQVDHWASVAIGQLGVARLA
jgi:DUF3037 family protein